MTHGSPPGPADDREPVGAATLRDEAVRGAIWASVNTWGVQFGSLFVFLFLARLLGPADFGLVALAMVYLDLTDELVDQGFSHAIVQRPRVERDHLDSALWMSLAIAVLAIVVTLVGAPVVGALVGDPRLAPVLRVLSLTLLFTALVSVQSGILRRRMAFRSLAIRGAASVAAGGAVGLGMALAGYGVWSLVGQQLAREGTSVLVLWRASGWRPRLRFSQPRLAELWAVAGPIMGTRLLDTLHQRTSNALIGATLGPAPLGYFAVGQRVATAVSRLLIDGLVQVALPTFARVQADLERLRTGYYRMTEYAAVVAFPAFLGLAVLGPGFIAVWFGSAWEESARVLPVLAILALVGVSAGFNAAVLQAVGAARVQFRLRILSVLTNLGAILIGLNWGIEGVAWAMLARAVIMMPVTGSVVHRIVGVNYRVVARRMGPALAGALATGLAVVLVQGILGPGRPLAVIVFGVLLGATAHGAVMRLLSPGLIGEIWSLLRHPTASRRTPPTPADPPLPTRTTPRRP